MKKLLAALLAMMMIVASVSAVLADAGSEPDWTTYDALIAEIKAETDFAAREAKMHQAEDMLMATGAVLPLYYYNDLYMQKDYVSGIYSNAFATKFFLYAENANGNTLRINLASEPDYVDPALNSSVDGACLAANSFGGLYTYDAAGQLTPNLATGYDVSEDGLTYVFHLRDGLKFSDGSDLTAKDFEYSWKRAAATETAADYSYMFNGIVGYPDNLNVKASEDGKDFTVVLTAPCAYMLDLAAFPTFFCVKEASVEGAEGYRDAEGKIANPAAWALEAGYVTSGPYTLTEWKHNESMVYTKNPYYWDAENVKIETITYMLSADDTAIYAAYQAGDLDFCDTVPNDEIGNLIASGNPEFHLVGELGTYYVGFNVKSKLFDGKTVEQANAMRLAFSKLVDREWIVETCGQTGQVPATSFIPDEMADGNGGIFNVSDDAYTYPCEKGYYDIDVDVEGAIALLESAGFKFVDGKLSPETPLTFEYLSNESSGHVAIAECIQADLAQIGIVMTIRTCAWDVFLEDRKVGNFDIAREGWIADFNDPINMLEMWTTDSGNNDCQFGR